MCSSVSASGPIFFLFGLLIAIFQQLVGRGRHLRKTPKRTCTYLKNGGRPRVRGVGPEEGRPDGTGREKMADRWRRGRVDDTPPRSRIRHRSPRRRKQRRFPAASNARTVTSSAIIPTIDSQIENDESDGSVLRSFFLSNGGWLSLRKRGEAIRGPSVDRRTSTDGIIKKIRGPSATHDPGTHSHTPLK